MNAKELGAGRPVAAIGGVILIASLFLPWTSGSPSESVWGLNAGIAILAASAGVIAITAAATNGQVGLFRPDVSMSGGADLFNVATAVAVGAFLLFDLSDPGPGAFIALVAATVTACACADWRPLKGAPVFPRA